MKIIFLFIISILLISCEKEYSKLTKYELSIDEFTAKHQCNTFFKQFHGKYVNHRHYGETRKLTTLKFYKRPDCTLPCITNDFNWVCSFQTNDDEDGIMIFSSRIFTE